MTDAKTQADLYTLAGPDVKITFRPQSDELTASGALVDTSEDKVLRHHSTTTSSTGLIVTASILDSSRNGTQIVLTLLLPTVRWPAGSRPAPVDVTGAAIVAKLFHHVVGGVPPVLQSYDEVQLLKGTASRKH